MNYLKYYLSTSRAPSGAASDALMYIRLWKQKKTITKNLAEPADTSTIMWHTASMMLRSSFQNVETVCIEDSTDRRKCSGKGKETTNKICTIAIETKGEGKNSSCNVRAITNGYCNGKCNDSNEFKYFRCKIAPVYFFLFFNTSCMKNSKFTYKISTLPKWYKRRKWKRFPSVHCCVVLFSIPDFGFFGVSLKFYSDGSRSRSSTFQCLCRRCSWLCNSHSMW